MRIAKIGIIESKKIIDPSFIYGEFISLSTPDGITLDPNYLQFLSLPDIKISDPTLQTAEESLYMYFNNF